MRLRLHPEQVRDLVASLEQAGTREIGGQLFGEQIAPSHFAVTDVTIQRRMGTIARFVVDLVQAARDALRFFEKTDHRYARFNYIGEWHSHPRFAVHPSSEDLKTMRRLVGDPDFRGNFAVLMIVKLDPGELNCGGWLFDPTGREHPVTIDLYDD